MNTKQIIIIRKDLKMRRGKEISQACHASMAFLTKGGYVSIGGRMDEDPKFVNRSSDFENSKEITHWLENSFRKIVCYVNSEEELVEIYEKAKDAGLIAHLIEDNGVTEFKGVKTKTAIAIGPAEDSKFIGITDHLPLY